VEPKGENRVKIHPVEVETIGLTEIVKERKKYETSPKHMAFPVTTVTGWPNNKYRLSGHG